MRDSKLLTAGNYKQKLTPESGREAFYKGEEIGLNYSGVSSKSEIPW